jgi:hypothetical protein
MFTGAGGLVMVLAPMGGAMIGLVVARYLLRDHRLPFTATWGEVRPRLAAKS